MKKILPIIILSTFLIISIISFVIVKDIKIYTGNELFYEKDHDSYKNLVYIKNNYSSGKHIIISLYNNEIFSSKGLTNLLKISEYIKNNKNVDKVIDISSASVPSIYYKLQIKNFYDLLNNENKITQLKNNIINNNLFKGSLVSSDGRITGILVFFKKDIKNDNIVSLINNLKKNFDSKYYKLRFAGFVLDSIEFEKSIIKDQRLFSPFIILIFSIILFVIYRNIQSVIYPLIVMIESILISIAIFKITGHFLTPMSSLLIPVIMTISITDSIHILNRYFYLKSTNTANIIKTLFLEIWKPCFLTSLTTAFGFLFLLVFRVPALNEFGVYAAIGCIAAYFITILNMISLLKVFGIKNSKHFTASVKFNLIRHILKLRYLILGTTIIISCLSVYFIKKININTNYTAYLRKGGDLYNANNFIDHNLTGINQVDIILRYGKKSIYNSKTILRSVIDFENNIRNLSEVTNVVGPADFIDEYFRLTYRDIDSTDKNSIVNFNTDFKMYHKIENEDRISLRVKWLSSKEAIKFIDKINKLKVPLENENITVKTAGEMLIFNHIAETLVKHQVISIISALVIIIGVIGISFRSFKVFIISFFPNLIPIIAAYSIMGLLKIDLSLSTAMVASAAIGLIVDDTIHFVFEFLEGKKKNLNTLSSIDFSYSRAAKAAFITSAALCSGFSAGFLSNFKPTYYFTIIIIICIATAFVCDILLTPILIYYFYKEKK